MRIFDVKKHLVILIISAFSIMQPLHLQAAESLSASLPGNIISENVKIWTQFFSGIRSPASAPLSSKDSVDIPAEPEIENLTGAGLINVRSAAAAFAASVDAATEWVVRASQRNYANVSAWYDGYTDALGGEMYRVSLMFPKQERRAPVPAATPPVRSNAELRAARPSPPVATAETPVPVTRAEFTAAFEKIERALLSRSFAVSAVGPAADAVLLKDQDVARRFAALEKAVAHTNKIDTLPSVTIVSPTVTGTASFSGSSSFDSISASSGTFTGAVSGTSVTLTASSTLAGIIVSDGGLKIQTLISCSGDLETDSAGIVVCGTDQTGSGGTYPFTPSSHFATSVSATTTALWAQSGIFASSTLVADNATTTNATTTSFFSINQVITNATATTLFSKNVVATNATNTSVFADFLRSINTIFASSSVGNLTAGTLTATTTSQLAHATATTLYSPLMSLTHGIFSSTTVGRITTGIINATSTSATSTFSGGVATGALHVQSTQSVTNGATLMYFMSDPDVLFAGVPFRLRYDGTDYVFDRGTDNDYASIRASSVTGTQFSTNGLGSAVQPVVSPLANASTGIFFPSDSAIAFSINGFEHFRLASTVNVGISTTSPWARMSIAATSSASNINLFAVSTSTLTSTTTAFIINSQGEVGIASTSIGAYALAVGGSSYLGSGTVGTSLTIHTPIINYPAAATATIPLLVNAWSISSSTATGGQPAISVSYSSTGATSTIGFFVSTTTALVGGSGVGVSSNNINMIIVGNGKVPAGMAIVRGGLCVDGDGWCHASTTGRVSALTFQTAAASDIAEMYRSTEPLEPGDIVEANGQLTIGLASATNAQKVLGVVSTEPGFTLAGDLGENALPGNYYYPIALAGRVPVKINLEGGPVLPGDRLALSNERGVAKKATERGATIGIALESFDTTDTDGLVTVFIDKQYIFAGDVQLTDIENGAVSSRSSASLLASISEWVGNAITASVATFKTLSSDFIKARTIQVTDGMEMTDSATGEVYCLRITNGEWNKVKGSCSTPVITSPAASAETSTTTPSSLDTEPPVIVLNGLNPSRIEKGATYSDLGATVTDNVDQNLGVYVSGDQIDTSLPGTYTVTYTAADSALNRATTTRTVIVEGPQSQVLPDSATSTDEE